MTFTKNRSDESKLPQRFANPRNCPICYGIYLFDTDHLGRVFHKHPPKKCVAPTYAPEDVREVNEVEPPKPCIECGGVVPQRKMGPQSLMCSRACKRERNLRLNRTRRQRERRRTAAIWKVVAQRPELFSDDLRAAS